MCEQGGGAGCFAQRESQETCEQGGGAGCFVHRERIRETRRCMNKEVVLAVYTCTERKDHRGQEMYEQGDGASCKKGSKS